MGVYTEGSLYAELSRELTEAELAEVIGKARTLNEEQERAGFGYGNEGPLGDSWDVNGDAWGDIGRATFRPGSLDIEVGGKVYEIEQAVGAFLGLLPDDVTATGEGMFETEGEHWALRIVGRETVTLGAELVVIEPDPVNEGTEALTNEARADRARQVLAFYGQRWDQGETEETRASDLLADLHHLAQQADWAETWEARAQGHHLAELGEEGAR